MLNELEKTIKDLLKDFNKNVVVYSAIFPFVKLIKNKPEEFCNDVLDILINNSSTLFLPTFTSGFKNGLCNLDGEPSSTGVLTEIFRKRDEVQRTFCPFFSFGVFGECANETIVLRPIEAWGKGSLYEWFYNNKVTILTLGTHPTHCSFTHYAEWLMKDLITYRYDKSFEGKITYNGKTEDCKTALFVRNLDPSPMNDWTWAINEFLNAGMKMEEFQGIKISAINAKNKIDALLPLIEKDPYCLISNSELFKNMTLK